jgi:aspartate/methionine/tyrosine aminotransferase
VSSASVPVGPACRAIAAMPRSGIREVMDLARERADVVHLEVGEPDFPTPSHIVEAGTRALADGHTKYTANAGTAALREAIATKLARVNGLAVEPGQVVVTHGAVNALLTALMVLVEPGEGILVPDPGWPNYRMMATMLGAQAQPYPLDPDTGYEPDLERLAELAARAGAKVLLTNSPGNPTGGVWRRETVRQVVEIAGRHGLYVLSDEVYEEIVFAGEHVSPAVFDEDGRVITVSAVSKTYAMTGWRIGYLAATPELAQLTAKTQEAIVACPNAMAQAAAEAALTGPQDCVAQMRAAYRRRRDVAVEALAAARMLVTEPRGAFYVLADVSRATEDTAALARSLVIEHGVAVAPGSTFGPGGERSVRLSLASPEAVIEEGIARLVRAVAGGPSETIRGACT